MISQNYKKREINTFARQPSKPSVISGSCEFIHVVIMTQMPIPNMSRLTTNFKAHDHLWKLAVCPRGDDESNADVEHLSIFFVYDGENTESDPVVAKAVCRSKTKTINWIMPRTKFYKDDGGGFGWPDFGRRIKIIEKDCDDEGTLTITVELQVEGKRLVWFPQLNYCDNIIGTQLYRSMKKSDVSFIVGNSKVEVRGHTCIIDLRASALSELIETEKESLSNNDDDDRSETQLVILPDMDVKDFTTMLEFIYTDKVPTNWKKQGGDIEKS